LNSAPIVFEVSAWDQRGPRIQPEEIRRAERTPRATQPRQAMVTTQAMHARLAMYVRQAIHVRQAIDVRQIPYFTGATCGPTVNGLSDWIHSL